MKTTTKYPFKDIIPNLKLEGKSTAVVGHNYDMKGERVELAKGKILKFGDLGYFMNGTLVGHDSIIYGDGKIFENVKLEGTWSCPGKVEWFAEGCEIVDDQWGVRINKKPEASQGIQDALDSTFRELVFPPRAYYINEPLVLKKEKKLILQGSSLGLSLYSAYRTKINTCILFTDKNIPLLKIATDEGLQNRVEIEGGNFDTSLCDGYSSNAIEVLAEKEGQRLWGLDIKTTIRGRFGNEQGVGININPAKKEEMTGNKAYITNVRLRCTISDFGVGVKAMNWMKPNQYTYLNWCTDMKVDGSIINCPVAVETNVEDSDIKSTIQAGFYYGSEKNGKALIVYSGTRASISSPIYDIQMNGGKWSNQYALSTSTPGAVITYYGPFASFLELSKKLGKNIILG